MSCNLLLLLFLSTMLLDHGLAQQKLQMYNVDRSKITVSGISSGGIMSTQFHFSHSSIVKGNGVFASVPYMCGNGGVSASLLCMQNPSIVNVPFLISEANALAFSGLIDSTSNVEGSRVFVYHGSKDSVVLPKSGENVKELYQYYGAQVQTEFNIPSDHAHPTDNTGAPCGSSAANDAWISNCNYQGSFEMFNYLYGGGLRRPDSNTVATGDIILFDQSEFFTFAPSISSMDTAGFLYVPSGCRDKSTSCALHIAFHGCVQNRGSVSDAYVKRTGYIEAAELNNIIVLFPQTTETLSNPNGCWDWWGYLNQYFATRDGNQVLATYRMMNRLISG